MLPISLNNLTSNENSLLEKITNLCSMGLLLNLFMLMMKFNENRSKYAIIKIDKIS